MVMGLYLWPLRHIVCFGILSVLFEFAIGKAEAASAVLSNKPPPTGASLAKLTSGVLAAAGTGAAAIAERMSSWSKVKAKKAVKKLRGKQARRFEDGVFCSCGEDHSECAGHLETKWQEVADKFSSGKHFHRSGLVIICLLTSPASSELIVPQDSYTFAKVPEIEVVEVTHSASSTLPAWLKTLHNEGCQDFIRIVRVEPDYCHPRFKIAHPIMAKRDRQLEFDFRGRTYSAPGSSRKVEAKRYEYCYRSLMPRISTATVDDWVTHGTFKCLAGSSLLQGSVHLSEPLGSSLTWTCAQTEYVAYFGDCGERRFNESEFPVVAASSDPQVVTAKEDCQVERCVVVSESTMDQLGPRHKTGRRLLAEQPSAQGNLSALGKGDVKAGMWCKGTFVGGGGGASIGFVSIVAVAGYATTYCPSVSTSEFRKHINILRSTANVIRKESRERAELIRREVKQRTSALSEVLKASITKLQNFSNENDKILAETTRALRSDFTSLWQLNRVERMLDQKVDLMNRVCLALQMQLDDSKNRRIMAAMWRCDKLTDCNSLLSEYVPSNELRRYQSAGFNFKIKAFFVGDNLKVTYFMPKNAVLEMTPVPYMPRVHIASECEGETCNKCIIQEERVFTTNGTLPPKMRTIMFTPFKQISCSKTGSTPLMKFITPYECYTLTTDGLSQVPCLAKTKYNSVTEIKFTKPVPLNHEQLAVPLQKADFKQEFDSLRTSLKRASDEATARIQGVEDKASLAIGENNFLSFRTDSFETTVIVLIAVVYAGMIAMAGWLIFRCYANRRKASKVSNVPNCYRKVGGVNMAYIGETPRHCRWIFHIRV